jgi:hypothetical protein
MKNLYSALVLIIIFIASGCGNNSESSSNSNSSNSQVKETISGTYTYSDNSVELEITITGDSWYGKTMIISGFGSDYDNQNVEYDNGTVSGNDLYDSSGIIKIGYVSGNSVTTSIGGQSVTLSKN